MAQAQVGDTTAQRLREDSTRAQQMLQQQLGSGVSQAAIIERLRQSGLTRSQVRARLQQMGYDPGLADQYYDAIERGGVAPEGQPSSDFLSALQGLGITVPGVLSDSAAMADSLRADSLAMDTLETGLQVFGLSLFRNTTTLFDPVTVGPVDPDYRIGPGDEVVLIVTGDVELAYSLEVTREGYIIIPDVGQVAVNGLTVGQLEERLRVRLGQVYSGIRGGAEATTHFQVSLGRLRTFQVYVMGEVERPGAYPVNAFSTVLTALYQAGGPTETGSFRRVEVRRGGRRITTLDLYDYLLSGDSRSDVRLQQGDIVFVPVTGPHVAVDGQVRRPAIYETTARNGLRDVLGFAGGLRAGAVTRRIQVDRVLPPEERRPGIDRVMVDVPVEELRKEGGELVPVQDGDSVVVFGVSEERRHRVVIDGGVHRPGVYQWSDGMTLWDLIDRSDGLADDAYRARAHIYRLRLDDGTRRLIQAPLGEGPDGQATRDVLLADRDSIVVLSRDSLGNNRLVTIDGYVKEPGTYNLADGMTVKDLILAAGGFTHGAGTTTATVARLPDVTSRTDTTAVIMTVGLGSLVMDTTRTEPRPGVAATLSAPDWLPDAAEFPLLHGDHVFVRRAAGYEPLRTINVTGEITVPGRYVLDSRVTRITDIIRRAGGLTEEAYAPGAQLYRGGQLVALDLEAALQDPSSLADYEVEANDSIFVPKYDPTVLVRGAVAFETRVPYEQGRGLDFYINQAGGYTDLADRGRVSVTFQNGERAVVDNVLVFRRKPRPRPGSQIFVPSVPASQQQGIDLDRILTVLTSLATVLALIRR